MKRKDLKPGTVFVYLWPDGTDRGTRMYVDYEAAFATKSVADAAALELDVRVIWTPPETKEEYDARTGTTRHTEPAVTTQPHYTALTPEPIDVIQAWGLGFHLGNVVKYVARHGRKPGVDVVEDLKKARAYLSREIARLEGRNAWE